MLEAENKSLKERLKAHEQKDEEYCQVIEAIFAEDEKKAVEFENELLDIKHSFNKKRKRMEEKIVSLEKELAIAQRNDKKKRKDLHSIVKMEKEVQQTASKEEKEEICS